MAKVMIENGEVTQHLSDKGFTLETTFKTRSGEEKKERWTVWGKQPAVGSVVTVRGDISVKLEEFEGENGMVRYARAHINNPQVEASQMPPADPMQNYQPTIVDDGVPF
jgi:hypothetical protein